MFKRFTLAMLMIATLGFGTLGIASSADAQRFRGGWYGYRPSYQTYYYAPPAYPYYAYPRTYSSWYGAPYGGYYYQPYGVPYYTARPGIQFYYR